MTRAAVFLAFSASLLVAGAHAAPSAPEYARQLDVLENKLTGNAEDLKTAAEYRQLVIEAGAYDRSIHFFEKIAGRPGAGSRAYLNLALAYVDKVPVTGAIRQLYLGRDAINALGRSIQREPTDLAYMVRGVINLYYDSVIFHRTDDAVSDLETARRLAGQHAPAPYVARIYVGLGDGYWRLKNFSKAREVWRDGLERFPDCGPLRDRLTSPDNIVRGIIAHALDPDIRVDTTLRDVFGDAPAATTVSEHRENR